MALSSLRLRRTLSGLTALQRSLSATSALSTPRSSSSPPLSAQSSPASHQQPWSLLLLQSRGFRSSSPSSYSSRTAPYGGNKNEEIGPDTILFEGCDYNHWLIVMDFPKDNPPPREEMIRTYEETAAKGLNISVEEAKKKIYACSTTTYTGFQVLMSEAESEKFNDVPGVIFVLPDSYIDPTNKEYGGDKYINGEIIPRPPPVQYGRPRVRYNDANRYDRQGPRQDVGNYGPSQNYPQSNSIPPRQGENRGPIPGNTPGGRDTQGNYYPQEQRNLPQGGQRNYAPPGQGEFRRDERNYGPPHTQTPRPGLGGNQEQGASQSLGQGPSTTAYGHQPRAYGQGPSSGAYGQGPSSGVYGQGPSSGAYGQGPSSGGYGQGPSSGGYGQGPSSGAYGQGPSSGAYGQGPSSGPYRQGPSSGPYGQGPNSGNYGPGPNSAMQGQGPNSGALGQGPGSFGQGPSSGAFEQGLSSGAYGQGPNSAAYGQGPNSTPYGQGPSTAAYGQGPSSAAYGQQGEQRNIQGDQSDHAPMGQTGIGQGRY